MARVSTAGNPGAIALLCAMPIAVANCLQGGCRAFKEAACNLSLKKSLCIILKGFHNKIIELQTGELEIAH